MLRLSGVVLLVVLLLNSCTGSDTYRGAWKATDTEGNEFEIVFNEKDFSIFNAFDTVNYAYHQHSVRIRNSVETYGINVKNNGSLQIEFPIAGDESKGAILDKNNYVVYLISRKEFLAYDDIYGV